MATARIRSGAMSERPDETTHPLEAAHRLRARWLAGESTFGGWIYLRDPVVVELVARSDVDWVCVDTHHGMARAVDVAQLMQAVALGASPGLVRVPWNEPGVIMNALDAGATGVIVPMVGNADEAERAVAACRYPPRGIRSWGPTRAALGAPAYSAAWANERVLCIVMIETEEGLENAERIVAVNGIDAVFIGPTDLSLSFGVARDDPANDERVMELKEACDRGGIPVGVAATSVEEGRRRAASGFAFIALPSDAVLLRQAYGAFLESLRSV